MSWDRVENNITSGPKGALKTVFVGIVLLMVVGFGINIVGGVLGWFGEAQQVAREEFGPRAILKKYEWFKTAAAELDAKKQGIQVLQTRIDSLRADYEGVPRREWDRIDKQNMNVWYQEVAGMKLSFNNLAAEWNAQISKFNWKPFVGDLPPGAEETLSKQYAPYITH